MSVRTKSEQLSANLFLAIVIFLIFAVGYVAGGVGMYNDVWWSGVWAACVGFFVACGVLIWVWPND